MGQESVSCAGKSPKAGKFPLGFWSCSSFPLVWVGLGFPICTEFLLLPTRGLHFHILGTAVPGSNSQLNPMPSWGMRVRVDVLLLTYAILFPSRHVGDDSLIA